MQRYELASKQQLLELETTRPPWWGALLTQLVLAEGSTDVISLLLVTKLTLLCSEVPCQVPVSGHSELARRFLHCSTFHSARPTWGILPKGMHCVLN